jgi:hypothetical protein
MGEERGLKKEDEYGMYGMVGGSGGEMLCCNAAAAPGSFIPTHHRSVTTPSSGTVSSNYAPLL